MKVGNSERWLQRFIKLTSFAEFGTGRRFFDLFLRLVDIGILDSQADDGNIQRDFWSLIYNLPKQNSEWSCEAIGHFLNRRLNISLKSKNPNPFEEKYGVFPYSAYYKEAISNLAVQDPEEFTMITEQHLRYSNFETIQYLLVRAYTANGEKFANEAIDYLCEQPLRLETGGDLCRSAVIGNEPYWATQLLLKSITPHSSEEKLSKLEDIILNYYTEFEKTAKGFICRGEAQLLLLEAIDSSRRSELATRRLQEWRRKFPDTKGIEILQENEPPDSLEASLVKSPIPQDAADKMSDKQWLQAIAHYDYGDLGTLFQRTGKLIGGAHQLSSNLENQVKKQPLRFASLIWKIPDNANSSYFDAILTGIAEVSTDVETALQVCQRCHQLPNRPCGRSIAWLFNKLSKLQWSEEAFEILIWYALNDPNPQEETWRTNNSGNIVSFGINSTRGAALSAIAKLIFADKSRTTYFQRYLEQIIQDPSIGVRCCASEALTAVLNYDNDLAVSLFIKLCQTEDDILGTPTVERFLYYVLPKYFQVLMPILERMITSNLPEVIKVVTQQVCRASLVIEEAYPLAENCLSSTEQHRISATRVFVDNLNSAHFRKFCEDKLTQMFNDSDEKVRAEAARCFFQFERDELGNYHQLVENFVESSAFATNYRELIHALEKTTAKLPDITCCICEKIVSISKSNNRSDASHIPYADKISKLLIRVYSQSKDEKLRSACSSASLSRCLDLVDSMAQTGVYGLSEALQEFER